MKKSVQKVVSLFLTVALGLGIMAGCGGKKEEKTENDPVVQATSSQQGEEKVKIKFWNHYAGMKDLTTELVNKYNQTNKDGVEIELTVVADKYGDVLNMAFSSGEVPDVFSVGGPSLSKKLAENKWGEPLDKYMTPAFKSKFGDSVWVPYNNVYGGSTYTIPDTVSTYKMIYNKDLFKQAGLDPEKPPKTFAELRDYAKKITAIGGGKVSGLGLPMGDGGGYIDATILNGMGMNSIGSLRGYDYKAGKFDFSVYKPLVQTFVDIKNDGSMLDGMLLLNGDQGKAKFAEGNVGIMGAPCWDPAAYAKMTMNFEMGVSDFPTIDGTPKGKGTIQMGSGYAMSAACKNKEKAWKVIEYIFSKDYMGPFVKNNGSISLLKEISSDSAYKPDIKYLDKFVPGPNDAVWPPLVPGLTLQGDNMQTVFIQMINGQKKVDDGLADLTKRYNDAFDAGVTAGTFKKEDFTKPDFDPLKLK